MKIILGVGGGIAAYKSAEIARLLMQEGHEVQAVMTRAAQEFIRPLTFAALTGRKTLTDLFAIESAIEHIAVAQENELMAIAPATADLIARLAHGLADDFLTTLYLAFTGAGGARPGARGRPGEPGGKPAGANRGGGGPWRAKPCTAPPVPRRSRSTRC